MWVFSPFACRYIRKNLPRSDKRLKMKKSFSSKKDRRLDNTQILKFTMHHLKTNWYFIIDWLIQKEAAVAYFKVTITATYKRDGRIAE
jgi:hypothetical protein